MLIFEFRIVFKCTCSWKMAPSDDVSKKISQLHQDLVNAYKERFMCENGQVAVVKSSPIWKIWEKISKYSLSLNLKFILK